MLACKKVECKICGDNPHFIQIINEYKILKEISFESKGHPNIVKFIAGFNPKGADVIYLFLEYCNEGDLDSIIKKNWQS